MVETNDWNSALIREFRENSGKLGGQFAGAPLLLLTSTGAKSGLPRTSPMMYLADGDRWIVFASKAGAPTNPDWYHNLVAHPTAAIEVGAETVEVSAEVLTGEERDRLFKLQSERYSGFAEYQGKTSRIIPVIALRRAG